MSKKLKIKIPVTNQNDMKLAEKATTLEGYGISDAYTKTEIDSTVSTKADKATTLAGYGVTDAYTKEETTSAITDKIAEVVANAPEDFDTLKEVADWIKSDTTGAAKMQSDISTLSSNKADLSSPALTGTPTAPTAETSTNNTQVATTAYVNNLIASKFVKLTQAQYDALTTKDSSVFYFITE